MENENKIRENFYLLVCFYIEMETSQALEKEIQQKINVWLCVENSTA